MHMHYGRNLRGICLAASLLGGTITALAQADSEVIDLPSVPVSADASADGLLAAFAGGQVASGARVGILGSAELLATPFSITSYTQELIDNQLAASVGEVLLNDPAVRVARGFGNFQQLYLVRGLPVYSDDMAYNGLYGLLPRQYLATELVERVDVLRGANAFLNGAAPGGSGLGGAINIVPKRAAADDLTQLTTGISSGGSFTVATDLSRRFLDDQLGARLNASYRDGDTVVEGESASLGLIAVGVDWRGDKLRISSDLAWQDLQRDATQPSITFATATILDAPDASVSVAQPWTFSDERDLLVTLRAEYDLTDRVVLWVAGGTRQGEEENRFANPTVTANDGTTSAYRFDNVREDDVVTGEVGLRAFLTTGPVAHQVIASATAYTLDSKNAYAFSDFGGFAGNIYAPFAVTPPAATYFVGGSMADPLVTETTDTQSFALADVVSLLDSKLLLTLGLRHQAFEVSSYDYNSGARLSHYDESAVTPVGGVVYRVTAGLSVYANYIEGLTKGDIAPTTSGGVAVVNGGEALDPYTTQQYELGVKFELGRLGGSVGFFQSEKPVAGLNSANVYEEIDDQTYRGVELSLFGQVTDDLALLGGVSFLDTDLQGKDGIGAPTWQGSLGAEYALPAVEGLVFDGRVLYTDEQYANAANTQVVPAWERLDLGARYTMPLGDARSVTFRARVENVLGEDYWASAGGYPGAGYLTVGAPRTFLLSATFDF